MDSRNIRLVAILGALWAVDEISKRDLSGEEGRKRNEELVGLLRFGIQAIEDTEGAQRKLEGLISRTREHLP
ncbi:hypothetical protein A3H89_02400 [Candidatus Amesbacteria bacterium RIFCSPLOWO2_02_FULL_48_11]|uniref:Uncharacterized protein n=5 Tax=Candidatus Amesiibacteriota TaxID=1752730 RepID=A0A1F4ZAL3_9BACT|nr:MAG: hypothetical protein UX78_C0002G0100 [Candidatus Amesbacteria bacterium GW2011_GWA2_47_11]KKU94869.1 MAG: hypothetical protein UY22_C0005G0026 [Candidatus Amesbacteria bacterium GW2011_GWC1_48_10]KKW01057.1 MAG: hypothetical protein UY33_C0002G0047 [Candidatus Amesbacteria bacterium GW2011_GWA1_48_9]OGC89635.1 MAG: hypothetical protein A2V48_02880 [Candidatus Amesbacteria bacterium RBG_19FT_COMBO_48_16]OGC96965.1 MAG: hypothetical protein A3C34_03985 [Candidatus Amesbacteria bacterium R